MGQQEETIATAGPLRNMEGLNEDEGLGGPTWAPQCHKCDASELSCYCNPSEAKDSERCHTLRHAIQQSESNFKIT